MNKLILVILMLALLLGIQLKQNIAGGSLTYYSTESSVLYGTEITNHTLSHASDDKWYQVNSEKISSGAYVFSVVLDFSTNHAPSTLTQIGIFVEAHVNVKISANVMIYNFKEAIHGSHWVSLFQITNTTDTQFTWSTLANAPSFMNETGHVLLKFYYENFWAQTLFLDLAYITISVKLPTARFSYFPLNPLAYETVTFNASKSTSSGKITAYIWDFGDGTNGTGMLTTHEYHVHGNYTVSLTVTDSDGLSASTSTVIFVSEHDIAIYGLEYSPQEVYRCMIVTIVLTIKNEGTFHESFNATVYYGSDNIAV
jgi:PKD repeat protein